MPAPLVSTGILDANADPVMAAFDKAKKAADDYKKHVESQAVPKIGVGSLVSSAASAITSTISSALSSLTVAASAYLMSWLSEIKKAALDARAILRTSQMTGIDTRTLGGIGFLAKQRDIDIEGLQEGFRHYTAVVGSALAGNESAISTFRRMGISIEELRNLGADEMFYRVSQAISSMSDPFQRSIAEHELLSRRGRELAKIFRESPETIHAAVEEAKRMGLALNPEQMRRAAQGVSALNETKARWQALDRGIASIIASEVMPVVALLLKHLNEMLKSWAANEDAVRSFARNGLMLLAQISDGVVSSIATIIQSIAELVKEAATDPLDRWVFGLTEHSGEGLERLATRLSNLTGAAQGLRNIFRELDRTRLIAAGQDTMAAMTGNPFFSAVLGILRNPPGAARTPDTNAVEEHMQALRDQVKYWGMTREQIDLAKLKTQNLTAAQRQQLENVLKEAEALRQQLKDYEEIAKIFERGEKMTEEMMSPLEKLQEKLDELKEAFDFGAIDETTFARSVSALYKNLEQSLGQHERQFSDLIGKGSDKELQVLNKFNFGGSTESAQERIARLQAEALAEQKRQTAIDQEVLDAVRQINGNQLVIGAF